MEPVDSRATAELSAENLIMLVRAVVSDVHAQQPAEQAIRLDSRFEQDLGLDSLSRVELITRVEKAFELALPERSYAEIETVRDLFRAIQGARPSHESLSETTIKTVDLGTVHAVPDEAITLLDVLDWHVEKHPDRQHIQLLQEGAEGAAISYQQLKTGAQKVAAGLQQAGIQAAEPVAIMLPSDSDYFFSFFGILMAGGIPVPIYPPARPSQLEDHILRHAKILANCQAVTLITIPEASKVAHLLKSHAPGLKHIVTVSQLMAADAGAAPPRIHGSDIAFLQYTSGSTGTPKGVVLTHDNLLTNIRAMGRAVEASSEDIFVSWLPLYHDMGLIGAWLGSLYFAMLFVVMPPLQFLTRPERWLWAIHRYRGTLSASPNFGYEYCLKRLDDKDLEGLDLSSWRAAFNGAEPVSPDTMEQFQARFANYGFNTHAMMPVYGLAECSVGLAFPPLNRGPVIDQIDRTRFMSSGQAVAEADSRNALRFVSSGLPLTGHQFRVVDATGRELPERREGRLEFRGPSTTSGYYRNAEVTRTLFHEDWLDSGDLAYIANGEVYITGRIKDVIIRAGRNIYPHELEEAVGNIDGIRNGRVAVFGSKDPKTETERLIVLAETRSKDSEERERLRTRINTLGTDLVGAPPDDIVLAAPGTVLKTSSGKIRRAASRELYEQGDIGKRQRSVSLQVLRLALTGVIPWLQRSWNSIKSFAFAAYGWSVFSILSPIVWFAVTWLPRFSQRWAVMRWATRMLARATATPVRVSGLENLPTHDSADMASAYVLVSNHSSYLDSYALVAALPVSFRFIAKKELAEKYYIRRPLENIHTEFIERFDISKSVRDSQHLAEVLQAGHPLMFFAEGTFTRTPGLMPFHLGAFKVAAQAGVPVIPVAIRGARSILRAGSWFPRHGSIQIVIGEAIHPHDIEQETDKDEWKTVINLRDRCRAFILRHIGEPDLS
jgi:acyl carrier protein